MRTDLTADLGGGTVRGVVTTGALIEMRADRKWQDFAEALEAGDPEVVRDCLRACLKAAGDVSAVHVPGEVDRLIEAAGVTACQLFAMRLVGDALYKSETARKNSPAAGAEEAPAAS